MEELLRYRAMMKMYNHDTTHASGPNPQRYRLFLFSLLIIIIIIIVIIKIQYLEKLNNVCY